MARISMTNGPADTAGTSVYRRDRLSDVLRKILDARAGDDGSTFLPDEATAEPGALIHELHEVWQAQARGQGLESHSFENLQNWLAKLGGPIASLQHKLKGRLPIRLKEEREELERLI